MKLSIFFRQISATALLFLFIPFFIFSCSNNEIDIEAPQGEISITLSNQDSLPEVSLQTRSASPDVNNFTVRIYNMKGDLLKEWPKYSSMPQIIKFGEGKYKIKASYGDFKKQGFDLPAYEGSSDFTIAFQDKKDLNVNCKLANALISMESTEGMDNYFKDFTVYIIASGDSIRFPKGEKRTAYVTPTEIKVKIAVTSQSGKTSILTMPSLKEVQACDHYRLKVDVKDGAGNLSLKIVPGKQTEEVTEVIIPATEYSTSTPYFSSTGFTSDQPVTLIEEEQHTIKCLALVPGGIESLIMTVNSPFLRSQGWPGEINFATIDQSANASIKSLLTNMGIKWSKNMINQEIAEIDFSGLMPCLKAGDKNSLRHELILQSSNIYNKKSAVLPIILNIEPPLFDITYTETVAAFSSTSEIQVTVSRGNPEKINGVKYFNGWQWQTVVCTPESISGNICSLSPTLPIGMENIRIKALYGNNKRESNEKSISVVSPIFTIATPTFTDNSARLTIETPEEYDVSKVKFGLINYILKDRNGKPGAWQEFTPADITMNHDKVNRQLTIDLRNLLPSERYDLVLKYNEVFIYTAERFVTNKFTFEKWNDESLGNLQSGGSYGYTAGINSVITDHASIIVNNPTNYWSTQNTRTASMTNSPQNTWTIVPSTLKVEGNQGGAASLLRNIGWDNNTDVKSNTGKWLWEKTNKSDVPLPELKINTAGRIETTQPLRSKPKGVKFWYKFETSGSKDVDQGLVRIILQDINGNEISHSDKIFDENTTSWTQGTIELASSLFTEQIAKIKILCSSSIKLDDGGKDTFTLNYNKESNPCCAIGSQLWIDDLELAY